MVLNKLIEINFFVWNNIFEKIERKNNWTKVFEIYAEKEFNNLEIYYQGFYYENITLFSFKLELYIKIC